MREIIIMPTRSDRNELEDFTTNRFTSLGYTILKDTSPPYHDKCDIVPRVKEMWSWVKHYDWVWILENDDYYPTTYLDTMRDFRDEWDMEWIGSNRVWYYHIQQKRYQQFKWNWNSGLWNMGFKPDVLKGFLWPPDQEPFLDNWICKWVQHRDFRRGMFNEHGAIGIKGHNIGKSGSMSSHTRPMQYKNQDNKLEWLKSNTDTEYYNFIQKFLE